MKYIIFFLFINSSYTHANINQKFLKVGEEIKKIYSSMAQNEGFKLEINWYPNDKIINATGIKVENTWQVSIYGGLLSQPLLTEESFRFILCHEIGHIIGGKPIFEYSSNSGQPDYYAASVCMKLLLKDKNNSLFNENTVDQTLNQECVSRSGIQKTQNLCRRIGNAGLEMVHLLRIFDPQIDPSFSTPSPLIVDKMESGHPDIQCRLDTILAGALCNLSPKGLNSSEADTINFACSKPPSARPRCWFNPG